MKKKRNISWDSGVDEVAESLARERGLDVSALLAKLIEAEHVEARIAPKSFALSPGMQKLWDSRGKR